MGCHSSCVRGVLVWVEVSRGSLGFVVFFVCEAVVGCKWGVWAVGLVALR